MVQSSGFIEVGNYGINSEISIRCRMCGSRSICAGIGSNDALLENDKQVGALWDILQ